MKVTMCCDPACLRPPNIQLGPGVRVTGTCGSGADKLSRVCCYFALLLLVVPYVDIVFE